MAPETVDPACPYGPISENVMRLLLKFFLKQSAFDESMQFRLKTERVPPAHHSVLGSALSHLHSYPYPQLPTYQLI